MLQVNKPTNSLPDPLSWQDFSSSLLCKTQFIRANEKVDDKFRRAIQSRKGNGAVLTTQHTLEIPFSTCNQPKPFLSSSQRPYPPGPFHGKLCTANDHPHFSAPGPYHLTLQCPLSHPTHSTVSPVPSPTQHSVPCLILPADFISLGWLISWSNFL